MPAYGLGWIDCQLGIILLPFRAADTPVRYIYTLVEQTESFGDCAQMSKSMYVCGVGFIFS